MNAILKMFDDWFMGVCLDIYDAYSKYLADLEKFAEELKKELK